jgi:predicted outer membrane repeat protein
MRAELWPVVVASLTVVAAAQKCVPAKQSLTVTDVVTAAELAKAVKCSEGVFDVSWQGEVEPLSTIVIGSGTRLRITGSNKSGSKEKSPGASIRGQSKLQLFAVNKQGVLELLDLALSGGHLSVSSSTQGGAAVFVDEGGTLRASRVTFTDHASSSDSSSLPGGAVFAAKGAQLAFEQCAFTNNTSGASEGGAVYQQSGVAVVHNCIFSANSGSDGGALYSAAGSVNITDSYFFSNFAYATEVAPAGTAAPAAPGAPGVPLPPGGLPDANQAPAGASVAPPGAAVIASNTTVILPDGSAAPPGTSVPPPDGSSVAGSPVAPPASDSGYGDALPQGPKGGAVFVLNGTTAVHSSSFVNNSADFGAALCSNGGTAVSNSSFIGNAAVAFGGAVFYGKGSLSVLNSEFDSNSAGNDGGAVFQAKGTATLQHNVFAGNRAVSAGGAVAVQAVAVAAENNTYRHNSAGELGGALFIAVCREEVTTGIACDGTAAVCKHAHSVFLNNSADQGGSVYQRGGTLTLSDSVFSSNTALRSAGGAIWSSELSSLTVTAGDFSMNAAAVDGGALSIEGNSSIVDTQFRNNSATKYGGAVIVKSTGAVTFSTCEFSGNSAVYGGSLHAAAVTTDTEVQPLTVTGCTFIDSKGVYGGAAHVIRSAVTVADSTFTHNVASNLGGAICVEGVGVIAISSTTFDANTASTGGAVICQQHATASISTSVFTANTGVDGGAISIQCAATISDTLFNSNEAKASGGALTYLSIQLPGVASTIDNCTMHDNSAVEGGAIAVQQNVTLTISSSTITNNSAQLSAGGISQQSGYAILPVLQQGTVVQNNTAGCCYAAGFGINATTISNAAGNGTNSCADIDSGTDRQCCVIGEYSNGTACIRCPTGYACTTLGLTVTTLPVMPGRWRESLTQLDARQCWNEDACKGGVAALNISTSAATTRALTSAASTAATTAASNSYCAPGYKGPCKYHNYNHQLRSIHFDMQCHYHAM